MRRALSASRGLDEAASAGKGMLSIDEGAADTERADGVDTRSAEGGRPGDSGGSPRAAASARRRVPAALSLDSFHESVEWHAGSVARKPAA